MKNEVCMIDTVYSQVKNFLEHPDSIETFWDSNELVWIDWREYDEDIIRYFNEMMEDRLEVEMVDNGKPYGDDIVLIKGTEKLRIPYEEEMDRDTTIKYLNDFIKPEYEIRWFLESLGDDTLGFVLLKSDEWKKLEEEFEQATVGYYFATIDLESMMFDFMMSEVDELLELRSRNERVDFSLLVEWVKLSSKEKELKVQRENGEIDMKSYFESKKQTEGAKQEFQKNHPEIHF
ncbi:hypothetical protein [Filifactor alocis]|uniref:hypothetical protein n=1 Tax=Filifactor alocis TaxID=143361 RepID=UPI0028E60F9F|nr:hypothetical protein [Filifactor alocis]